MTTIPQVTTILNRPHALTMTQSDPTGTYKSFDNESQRRDFMRKEAILTLESLNDAAMGTSERYAILEDRKNNGYMIVNADHASTWVWAVISL